MDTMNEDQFNAIDATPQMPLCVVAGPGSGKTFTLIERVKRLQVTSSQSEVFLVLTFSKSAVAEMRQRLRTDTGTSSVDVMTFHAFGFKFISEYWTQLGYQNKPAKCSTKQAVDIMKVIQLYP